jgi:hypothetical protein
MAAYPVGKAQQMVLDALGLHASDFSEAEQVFESIGISVSSKRVGRSSIPVVSMKETTGGGWNAGGDGESYEISYKEADLSKLSEWMVK